jgi:lipopolysaccharide export system protein LptA
MCPDLRSSLLILPLLLAGIGSASAAPAAGTPPSAPIQIEADRAEIAERSGVSVYSGRVSLRQGDLEMEGDRLEIRRDGNTGSIHALLSGKPALLRQPTDTGEMVNARANRIDYRSRDRSLDLQGNAEFVRGRDRVSGQSIRYDANAKKLLATGPSRSGGRVQITIQPESQQDRRP